MKKRVVKVMSILLSVFCSTHLPAQTEGILTLKQCIETAISNNLQVRQAEYVSQSGKVTLQQAKANQLPYIGGSVNHGINQGRSIDPYTNTYADQQINYANYGINTSVVIWNGSSIQNNIKQNELNYQASQMDWQQAKESLTINVILAYLQILSNEEQLNIAKKQIAVTKSQVDRLEILNTDGAIAPSALYDLKGQMAGDELNMLNIKASLETAKISLAQLMNIPYNASVKLENTGEQVNPIVYDGTPDNIYQTATKQLAYIKAAELRKKSAEKQYLAAKGQLLPTLSFNGSLGSNYSSAAYRQQYLNSVDVVTNNYVTVGGTKFSVMAPQSNYQSQQLTYGDQISNNLNSSLSIGLQIPILNGLQARSRLNQARIAEKRTVFEEKSAKTQLRQAIDQAYINVTAALDRYQVLSKQVTAYTQSFSAAEIRFNAGVITSVDYLLVKNNLDKSQSGFVSAKYDYLLRAKILDFYQGKQLY